MTDPNLPAVTDPPAPVADPPAAAPAVTEPAAPAPAPAPAAPAPAADVRTEVERAIAERESRVGRRDHLRKLATDLYQGTPDEKIEAAAQLLPMLSDELVEATDRTARLEEIVLTPIPDTVPREIRQVALDKFKSGQVPRGTSLQEVMAQEIGAAVLAGTYVPPAKPAGVTLPVAAAPAPVVPAVAPPGSRPAPMATALRSVPDAGALPANPTEAEYLELLNGPRAAEVFAARRNGALKVRAGAP